MDESVKDKDTLPQRDPDGRAETPAPAEDKQKAEDERKNEPPHLPPGSMGDWAAI